MRIVGGYLGGRRLSPPAKRWPTRPTTDYAREALFNILDNRLDWASTRMLDCFGGTGAVSLEAISRGCPLVTYVERYAPAVRYVQGLAQEWELGDKLQVRRGDVLKFLKAGVGEYELVFMDPPYAMRGLADLPARVLESGVLAEGGLIVVEHGKETSLSEREGFVEERKYGGSVFSFFRG